MTKQEKADAKAAQSRALAVMEQEEPACWAWPVPVLPLGMDEEAAEQALWEFQAGRCAVCGSLERSFLVDDHDHRTGLIRGRLCLSCNAQEAHSGHPVFRKYRERSPAIILGVTIRYWSPWTGYALPADNDPRGDRGLRDLVDWLPIVLPPENEVRG